MNVALRPTLTLAEFLAWEDRQERRYEFDGVRAVAMTGGTAGHASLQRNLAIALQPRLRGRPCNFYGSDLKFLTAEGTVRYPDGMVVCAPVDRKAKWVENPTVVFEVLSPSTARTDRLAKAREYQASPSVMRYVMLEQDGVGAVVYARAGEAWTHELLLEDATLALPEIGVALPLAELYEGMGFGSEDEDEILRLTPALVPWRARLYCTAKSFETAPMLEALLSEGRPLLADGATGTNLFEMGLVSGETPELWNLEQAGKIRALHQSFVDAGADIILTNSFGGNRRRLMLHKLEGRVRELNRLAAEIAREVADGAGRRVVVAGSVGPTGDLLAPLGPLTEDEASEVFAEQIEGLKEGGADVVWIETMSAPEEIRAAARAATALGMPYTATASFDTAGRTMMGLSPDAYAELFESFETAPLAFGANCGVGAADLLVSVLGMTAKRPEALVIAKANAGVPQWHGAHIHYSGTPELMADYARLAVDSGARIVGGCCGNKAEHVAAMRRALDSYAPSERPTVESIVSALGPLVSPPAQENAAPRVRRRAREAS